MSLLAAAVILGLAGSVHCLAMCGPLCLAIFARSGDGRLRLRFLLYHGARVATYALLGLVAGGMGALFFRHLPEQAISIACGIIMIATALLYRRGLPSAPPRRIATANFALLGILNAFLPCGLLVAALAIAASSASALGGAAVMGAFGLTTMLTFALAGRLRLNRFFARPIAIRGLACAAGLLLVLRGLALDIPYLSPAIENGQAACQHCTPADR
jgi:sulfite exporter TauE/SafE